MEGVQNLVLAAHLDNGRWEDPLPLFRKHAAAVGHDGADELSADGVTREIPLEERTATERHWSLALEAFRLARNAPNPRIAQRSSDRLGSDSGRARRSHRPSGARPLHAPADPQRVFKRRDRPSRIGPAIQRKGGIHRRDLDFGHVRPRSHALRRKAASLASRFTPSSLKLWNAAGS